MRTILLMTFTIFALGARPALAYEDDVHYGLTKWLALKIGFVPNDAGGVMGQFGPGGTLNVRARFTSKLGPRRTPT